MKLVIVTGMSGAGKSTALKMLEDMGYFCVDNLPIALLYKFAELACAPGSDINQVAVGVDIRNGRSLGEMASVLELFKKAGIPYEILFLDASDAILVKRYKETRRRHPLAAAGRVEEGINKEREKLKFLKSHANYIIDTSQLLTRELKAALEKVIVEEKRFDNLMITVLSFGFKYGIPNDCDLVFDVRFLPNPYYVDGLKYKTGNDKEVQDFVMGYELSHTFLDKLLDMLDFLIPNYILEGKTQLVIGIGCTGGKHRSVTLANKLFEKMSERTEYGVRLEHRDVSR
ncbi:MAG TPA: RNase adapter RapZ [Candidatus Limivivens merdigallinarum]|uniref:RNase adapter RapZ n=1 Tax=Candidatus Limivivens merdigallinarum TaxID=2840859 RepID=A0A9D1D1Y2_9FIRM|nr:RNase adapter RapZ [Candidatus Limivivens merdigallinarum]